MIYDYPAPNILMLHGFYTPEECQAELDYATAAGFVEQSYSSKGQPEARRRAVKDDPVRATAIWDKVRFFPALETFYKDLRPDPFDTLNYDPIGLNKRLRYYQYEPGQRFAEHFDIMFRIDDDTRTFLTFIIYLNNDFEGGETRFGNVFIKPKKGSLIVFPHELKHEGMMVTQGCKTVFRSDIVYRRSI